jgi:hypothetical protein
MSVPNGEFLIDVSSAPAVLRAAAVQTALAVIEALLQGDSVEFVGITAPSKV